jgi:hypothetical protein
MGKKRGSKIEESECPTDRSLEKKIYREALTQTVETLNKNADRKKDSKKELKRKSREMTKQARNARVKEGLKAKAPKAAGATEDKGGAGEQGRLSRKERRLLKMKNHGSGISSKEYYEKYVKKNRQSEREKLSDKHVLPSRTKEAFPVKKKAQDHGGKAKRNKRHQHQ